MNRLTKTLLIVGVIAAAVSGLGISDAKAGGYGCGFNYRYAPSCSYYSPSFCTTSYYRPSYSCYTPRYSCYTPSYSCYTPSYAYGYNSCYSPTYRAYGGWNYGCYTGGYGYGYGYGSCYTPSYSSYGCYGW